MLNEAIMKVIVKTLHVTVQLRPKFEDTFKRYGHLLITI